VRTTVSLLLVGVLVFSLVFAPAFSVVRYEFVREAAAESSVLQSSGVPYIVVDGNLSDWAGVYPIINGTRGDRSSPSFYGITDCYVLVEQGFLYFVFQKQPGGSDLYQMFFCTDLSSKTGYAVNGMYANYLLEMSANQAFYKWSGNSWVDAGLNLTVYFNTLHSGFRTADGSLEVGYGSYGLSNGYEWYEGRISLSLLGDPGVFGLVFELPWERIVAPDTGYIVIVQSRNVSFAASYTGASTLHYGQPEDAVFNLLNFGPSDISEANLYVSLPEKLAVTSGQTTWQGTIPPGDRLTIDFQEEPLDYGFATSYSNFAWVDPSSGENQGISVPFAAESIPNVSLRVAAPGNMTVGIESSMNVTIANLDPLTAPLTLIAGSPWAGYPYAFDPPYNISLVLSPNATVQLLTLQVTPTTSGEQLLTVEALYNGTTLNEVIPEINVAAPRIYFSVNVPSKMRVNTVANISAVIENLENIPYQASFLLELGPGLTYVNGQNANITLPADSNTTVTLQMRAETAGYSFAETYLNGTYGQLDYPGYSDIDIEPASVNTSIIIVVAIIVLTFIVAVLAWRRRAISKNKNSDV
jgi:hypothetical protein